MQNLKKQKSEETQNFSPARHHNKNQNAKQQRHHHAEEACEEESCDCPRKDSGEEEEGAAAICAVAQDIDDDDDSSVSSLSSMDTVEDIIDKAVKFACNEVVSRRHLFARKPCCKGHSRHIFQLDFCRKKTTPMTLLHG